MLFCVYLLDYGSIIILEPNLRFTQNEGLPHFLRYTYATILYNANIDIKTTEKIMGHSNIRTTLDIYTSLNLNTKSVINKVNNYLTSCNAL